MLLRLVHNGASLSQVWHVADAEFCVRFPMLVIVLSAGNHTYARTRHRFFTSPYRACFGTSANQLNVRVGQNAERFQARDIM